MSSAPPRQQNQTARIVSNFLDVSFTNGGCFGFYYHMFGADVARLNVYQQWSNSTVFGNYGKAIWQKQGNKGNSWKYGQIYVGGSSIYRVRFIIEGIVRIFSF